MGLPEMTYEITFYDWQGGVDSIQQYADEATARSILRLFDEPESADLYSLITLIAHDWSTGTDTELEVLTF